jgi:hypothetical protein
MRIHRWIVAAACTAACTAPLTLAAQAPAAHADPMPDAQQIAAAVLPLPAEYRAEARVLGYHAGSQKLVTLREGSNSFICLATDPSAPQFHTSCYHKSMEPFMARGRALREQGVKGAQVDTVRFAEVKSGKLVMPRQPATLYQLIGPAGSYEPATNTTKGANSLFVIYMPGATAASTGLSVKPVENGPWLMFPGTPKAHIMLTPKM